MKKLIFTCLFVAGFANSQAQSTLFQDGFETYENFVINNFGAWTSTDLDHLKHTYIGGISTANATWPNAQAAMACQIFNPSVAGVQNGFEGENSNYDPHSGQKYVAFWAGVPTADNPTPINNDWLISPKIQLGESGNQLTFWIKSLADDDGLESYRVGVYAEDRNPYTSVSQFTIIPDAGGSKVRTAPLQWTKVTVNLDAYKNKPIRFSVNYVSSNNFMMMLDDVEVSTGNVLAANEISAAKEFAVYPNPSRDIFHFAGSKAVKTAEVFSTDGKLILNKKNTSEINLASQPAGLYILKVQYEDGSSTTTKLIKK